MNPPSTNPSFRWPGTVLGAVLGLGLLDQQVITPLIAALAGGLGVSVPDVGLAVSGYAIAASVTALVIGPLSDSGGRRPYLLGAAALMCVAAALVWQSPYYGHFLLARVAAGMAGGTISAVTVAWVADLVPYRRRGRMMAILMGGAMGAAVLGQVAAAFAAGRWGHAAVYGGLAAFAILSAAMLAGLPERRPGAAPAGGPGRRGSPRGWLPGYLEFLHSRVHRTAAVGGFCMAGSMIGVSTYAAGWLQESRGFTLEQVGLLYGAFGAAIMVVQPLSGWLADRFGKRRLAVMASIAAAALTLTLPVLSGPLLPLALVAFGCAGVARMAAFAALRSELVAPERRAAFMAFYNTFAQLGVAAAAALGSRLYPLGFSKVCWAMAGLGVLAAIFVAKVAEPKSPP